MRHFGMGQLPHERTLEKHEGKVNGEAGHSDFLYRKIGDAAAALKPQNRASCALIFDEINVVGDLAFKIHNGEYTFFGLVSEDIRARLFAPPPSGPVDERLKAKQATHALVFQVTTITTSVSFKRVCGIHPVARLNAATLDQLFWETVERLQRLSGLIIVAAICDGAGCNRLMMKMQTSELRKGSPNIFKQAWCFNKVADPPDEDPGPIETGRIPKIFFISDPSHLIKKYCNHWEKSAEGTGPRSLMLPDFLVRLVLSLFEPSGAPPVRGSAFATPTRATTGEECFARVFGRLYDLMASSWQPPYYHGEQRPINQQRPDPRVDELQDILRFVCAWHDYNEVAYAAATPKERSSRFISHQLYFDTQMMIKGFVGLLTYLEARDGVIRVIVRKLNQDSLESLFGQLRFNCGSGRDPSIFKAVNALPRVEQMRKIRRQARYNARTNSGQAGSSVRVGGGGGSDWLDGHRIKLPADFNAQAAAARAAWAEEPKAHPVRWQTLREIQAEDEELARRTGGHRNMRWLRASQHINKTGFSRMRVGLAVAVVSIKTAKQLRLHRMGMLF